MINNLKYPIARIDSVQVRELCDTARLSLTQTGACVLHNFLSPNATQAMRSEANELLRHAYHMESLSSLLPRDQGENQFFQSHILKMLMYTSLHVVAYDQFLESSLIKKLYQWQPLMNFISMILGQDQIYHYADNLGALNLAIMYPGDELAWHFDEVDFAVSLTIQAPEHGGAFECSPYICSSNSIEKNSDQIAEILLGQSKLVTTIPMTSGSLMVFKGRSSLHRVTKVTGSKPRIVALLGYDTKPNTHTSEQLRKVRYGRS